MRFARLKPGQYLTALKNLRLFLGTISQLRSSTHINHFKDIHEMALNIDWTKRNLEHVMLMAYQNKLGEINQKDELRVHEFKVYAQNGEDGLLLYLFSRIGVKNRTAVDIGCGGSSNTANLIINFGWSALEIDGSADNIRKTSEFYTDKLGNRKTDRVSFKQCWITKENVNSAISEGGIIGEIDLLSIDIDGNDYWVWEAIDVVNPRIVLIEYNASFGPERSLTVKYDPGFERWQKHPTGWGHGASLAALAKLSKRKGYILVGCDSNGVNAFFIRADLAENKFIELSPAEAYYSHFQRSKRMSDEEQFLTIKNLDYVEI
jgi:hypothetical protein